MQPTASTQESKTKLRKRRKISQNATDPQIAEALSVRQLSALERLLCGRTVCNAADAAGVSRETVHQWLRDDAEFAAFLNRGKQDLIRSARARLLHAVRSAVTTVTEAVEKGDLRTSLDLLKTVGILSGAVLPHGPETADEIAEAEREMMREARISKRENEHNRWLREMVIGGPE